MDDEQSLSKSRRNGKEIRRIDDINVRSDKNQPKNIRNRNNVKVIKRSNKLIQALDLPTICNLNPRSVYNKIDEFHNFVKEEVVDLLFMSESWVREDLTLDKIVKGAYGKIVFNAAQSSLQQLPPVFWLTSCQLNCPWTVVHTSRPVTRCGSLQFIFKCSSLKTKPTGNGQSGI